MATDNNIGKDLADLLATHNFDAELSNAQNNSATADDATVFKFDYVTEQGRNYGTAVIVVGDDNDLMLFYGDNLGKGMEPEDKDQWFAFMKELKDFSIRHNFHNFSPKNLNNLKHTMQGMAAIKEGLFEGYYGTRRVSYMGEATDARLVIKHNKIIGENDKRYRYVESLFIETADQERFKLPFKNLAGGRAMLEHVRQGGRPYDIRGVHITETVNEMAVLSRFRRAQQGRVFEGVTQELVEQANAYYESLHSGLKHMATATGYNRYFESWSPADTGAQEALVEDLKTMFIEQTLDTRIEAALPTLAKIQSRGQQMKEADIFESWANRLMEGTWALPDTPEAQEKLNKLMSSELIVGPDATNATELLYDVVGDDQLFDILSDLAERSKGRANIWDDTDVINRMQELGIQLPELSAVPGEEAVPTDADGTPPPTEVTPPPTDQQMMESTILDEAGETLDHILSRFKKEVKDFKRGADLDHNLYDALYDYYHSKGEIPYEVISSSRKFGGDAHQWVAQKLDREFGGLGFRGLDETDNLATFVEGTCNATMEGEYCPEHGLVECGTVAGSMAPVMGENKYLDPAMDPKLARSLGQSNVSTAIRDSLQTLYKDASRGHDLEYSVNQLRKLEDWVANIAEPIPQKAYNFIMGKIDGGVTRDPKMTAQVAQQAHAMMSNQPIAEAGQEAFINKHHDDAINYNAAITGSYYESDELARMKALALGEAVVVNPSTTIMNPDSEKMVHPDWEKQDVHDLQQAVADKIKYGGGSVPPAPQKSGLAAKSGDVIDVDAKEVAEDDIPDEFISNKTTGPSYNDVTRYAEYTKDMKQNFGADWKPTPGVAKPYDTAKLGTPQTTQAPVSVHESDTLLARIKSLALLK